MTGAFANMNTNAQAHNDLIISLQFDKSAAIILAAAILVAVVLVILFARKRRKT